MSEVRKLWVTGVIASLLTLYGCAQVATTPSATAIGNYDYEGLEQVSARGLDIAFVRPGVEFGGYTGLILEAPEVALRTPDRTKKEVSLSEAQRSLLRETVARYFERELAKLETLTLVTATGPNVLRLAVRVQDVSAKVAPGTRGAGGWSNVLLDAKGEATLVLELRDSESDEVLARGIDTRAAEGAAMRQAGSEIATKWGEVEELCERWAVIARQRLNALIESR